MSKKETPSPAPVSSSFKELSTAASELNAASDELSKSIAILDAELKKMNLGIPCWVTVQEWNDSIDHFFTLHQLGYARVGKKWGIALRTTEGDNTFPDRDDSEEWLFNEAPRSLRIAAIDKVPELLAKLVQEAKTATTKVKDKAARAREMAETFSKAAIANDSL